MGLSCGMSMVKYGLFIFNLICAIAGLALITVGVIPLFKIQEVEDAFPESNPAIVPIIVISLGSVIFLISFLGCCGAIRESQCMITMYSFFLLVLVVAQVVIAVYAFMFTDELANIAVQGFTQLWNNAVASPNDVRYLEAIYGIQRALECCGNEGPTDWTRPPFTRIPQSCCSADVAENSCGINNAFSKGCSRLLADAVNSSGNWIAWVAAVFAAFEFVGVVFACCLTNSIRNANRRSYA